MQRKISKMKFMWLLLVLLIVSSITFTGCDSVDSKENNVELASNEILDIEEDATEDLAQETEEEVQPEDEEIATDTEPTSMEYNGVTYEIIEVDGGDLSGERQANVAVNIGYGDREYWAFTNEYGQLVYVTADKVILQDDSIEPVNADGRYYNDEAKVPGVESDTLDEGHVIADSLGGVSNAYNITPQDSTLNRYGDQAYMEKVIRDAGGCESFVAIITYPDTTTQIPSHYRFEYILNGENIVDDFDNVNPDEVNAKSNSQSSESSSSSDSTSATAESAATTQEVAVEEPVEEIIENTDNSNLEVHITNTGKKYHSAGCQYLSKSDIVTTLGNAKASGLGPCSKCNPPQ